MLTLGQARLHLSRYAAEDILTSRIIMGCELLLAHSNAKDTQVLAAFEVSGGYLTLPPKFLNCLGIAVDSNPRPIYGTWYQLLTGGPGVVDTVFSEVLDLGDQYCTFKDPVTVNEDGCVLKVKSDVSETGLELTLFGIDDASEEVRTLDSGVYITGEKVTATTGGNTTSTTFLTLNQVSKPPSNSRVRIYAVDPDDSSETLIAVYEPADKSPVYRRYKVEQKFDENGEDLPYTVTALCRLRMTEVDEDTDVLPIGNLNALRDVLMHLQYVDNNDLERAEGYLQSALRTLAKEANRDRPASTFPAPIQVVPNTGWGSGMRNLY